MKTIKNAIILTLVVCVNVLFTSCSDDDTPQDTLIGKWQILKFGATDEEAEIEANECEQKSTLEFKSDKTFKNTFYYDNEGEEECTPGTTEGTWQDKGDDVLAITIDGETRNKKYYFVDGNLKMVELDQEGNEQEYSVYKKK